MINFEAITSFFFPTAQLVRAEAIGAGNINDTFRLYLRKDGADLSYLLQRLNTTVFTFPERVEANFQILANHLEGAGSYPFRILRLQATHTGQWHHIDAEGRYWRMLPWFEGAFAPEHLPTPDHAREAARAYGIFLRMLQDLPADRIQMTLPGFHDTAARFEQFKKRIAEDTCGRVTGVEAEIALLLPYEALALQIKHAIQTGDLPLRVTHNDTKAGNVLLDVATQQAAAVIDWDTVMPGTILSDFGDMVRTFVPDRYEDDPQPDQMQVRTPVLDALLEGFLTETKDLLTPYERTHLHAGACWMISEQALRFLSDYIANDVYYKVAFPEHNLVRARNQLALLRLVDGLSF